MASVSLSAENDDVKDSDSVVNSESEIASSIKEVKADDTPVENDDPNEPGSVAAKVVSKKGIGHSGHFRGSASVATSVHSREYRA